MVLYWRLKMKNKELLKEMVDQGYVMEKRHPTLDLYLYDYTQKCQFEKVWNEVTLNCRGVVLDGDGYLVAQPFPKFFNYEELTGLDMEIPKDESFTCTTKMDGSLGIVYYYEGEWRVNTRGSFNSDQAVWAKDWLDKNVNMLSMNRFRTFLFEIIYTSNRIVIDYEGMEGLVLLSIMDNNTGLELSYESISACSDVMGVEVTERIEFENFEDMFKAREILTKNEEGFVVTFENGFKFKLKGEEYCKLHRCLFNMTPLAFWDIYDWETMSVSQEFLEQFPEEFMDKVEEIEFQIEDSFLLVMEFLKSMIDVLPTFTDDREGKKERYLYLNERYKGYEAPLMTYLDGKSLERWVRGVVKPSSNIPFDFLAWTRKKRND